MGWPVLAEHCAAQLAREEVLPVLVRVVSRKAPVWAEFPKLCPLCVGKGVFLSRVLVVQCQPLF